MNRREFLLSGGASLALQSSLAQYARADLVSSAASAIASHRTPLWFQDAKFGISAQWTPQSVPEDGDWYARNMYIQGSPQYEHHLARYGHPSRVGFKDLCPLWKGSRWNPGQLMHLYRRAGAKYFVALANHHDGFDCWNSRYQPWNSVNMGPRRDILGEWASASHDLAIRFGVAFFCTQNWQWFQVSHGSDKTGAFAGVPYDGDLKRSDGRGQWWEGLDPQDIYCEKHPDAMEPSPGYKRRFELRLRDVIAQHHPDLLFYTDNGLPLGSIGEVVTADQISENKQRHNGNDEAVICTKRVRSDRLASLVCDRLPDDAIAPFPWQMDICIGDWHYKRGIRYKTAEDVLPYLIDVVSKRGNLLLNIPIRADGSIDDEEIQILEDLGEWFKLYGEGIFGTRPWFVFGEGPTACQMVDFPYRTVQYTERDIRFTAKAQNVYAFLLRWPQSGQVAVSSFGKMQMKGRGEIASVELLADNSKLEWQQRSDALMLKLPAAASSRYPCGLRLRLKV